MQSVSKERQQQLQQRMDSANFFLDYSDELRELLGPPPKVTIEDILAEEVTKTSQESLGSPPMETLSELMDDGNKNGQKEKVIGVISNSSNIKFKDPKGSGSKTKEDFIDTVDTQRQADFDEHSVDSSTLNPQPQLEANVVNMISIEEDMYFNNDEISSQEPHGESNIFNFFWINEFHRPNGPLILFGKYFDEATSKYASCSLLIEDVCRELYFLPREYKLDDNDEPTRETVYIEDVEKEVKGILDLRQIHEFSTAVCKRRYAFGSPDIPALADYLKLSYNFKSFQIPKATQGKTFSHVFGTESTILDQFLIKSKIKGPCWLQIKNHQINKNADIYCAHNIIVSSQEDVTVSTNPDLIKMNCPPLNIVSISLETILDSLTQETEIVAASLYSRSDVDIYKLENNLLENGSRFSYLRQLKNTTFPKQLSKLLKEEKEERNHIIVPECTERSMLQALVAKLHRLDPDVIVGHNFSTVHLSTLLRRMRAFDVLFWQKIGRLGFIKWPKFQSGGAMLSPASFQERLAMSGRLICDTFTASQDLIKCKSYHLTELALSQLNIAREDIKDHSLETYFRDTKGIIDLVNHCSKDAYLSYAIMEKLQILPLTKQLTNLAGNLWSRSINGNRLERNEYLLLHTFYEKGFVVPDRPEPSRKREFSFINEEDLELDLHSTKKHKGVNGKASYTGGLVLEPKKGFYEDYVLLLDFNSLYPSIIREFNVCFTTMEYQNESACHNIVPSTPNKTEPTGVLPQLVKVFVEQRQKIKKLMRNKNIPESIRKQYDIEQLALKLTANSMYGCLGSSLSRFKAVPLATYITSKGREILKATAEIATKDGLEVIYGDTDSIMISTKSTDIQNARVIGESLKNKINQSYNILEIDIDKYFKYTLLLQKKKYAAITVEEDSESEEGLIESLEVKGLDIVRRDWCELSHKVSRTILQFILSDRSRDSVKEDVFNYLYFIRNHAQNSEFDIKEFCIHKQLSKPIAEYFNSSHLPHVIVAKDMRKAGIQVRPGDTIPYIMCKDITNGTRPRMVEDVLNSSAEIDITWYLRKQILPPVIRLCKQIKGIDLQKVADCLDADLAKPTDKKEGDEIEGVEKQDGFDESDDDDSMSIDPDLMLLSGENRYKNMQPIQIYCDRCNNLNNFSSPIRDTDANGKLVLFCNSCKNPINTASALVQVIDSYRSSIHLYYASHYKCDNPSCGFQTPTPLNSSRNCIRYGCDGDLIREVSPVQLYRYLSFIAYVFNANESSSEDPFKRTIKQILETSSFRYINLLSLQQ